MKVVMNEKRVKIVNVLKGASKPMTLAEISEAVGEEVKTGTTNAMVTAGVIVKAGVREVKCPVCGRVHKVAEYTMGVEVVEKPAEKPVEKVEK